MTVNPMVVMSGAIFLTILLILDALFSAFSDNSQSTRAIRRRLRLSQSPDDTPEAQAARLRRRGLGSEQESVVDQLDRLLVQAGTEMSLGRLLMRILVVYLLVSGGLTFGLGLPLPMGFGLGVFLVPGSFIGWLLHQRARRQKLFTNQLPDALDIIVRSLRAGHPVTASLLMVAKQMPAPIGPEIAILTDEMTYGMNLQQALANLNQRVASEELHFMTVAIKVQAQVGGNLAEVLSGLAKVIRARRQMTKRVRAISAEGRLSAWVISAMPFLISGIVMTSRPAYFLEVMSDPIFPIGIGFGVILVSIGIYTVFRMVRFRV